MYHLYSMIFHILKRVKEKNKEILLIIILLSFYHLKYFIYFKEIKSKHFLDFLKIYLKYFFYLEI
jgi:hypothetical protein